MFSKEYQLVIPYQISLNNFPADKVLLNSIDTSFLITIKSQGFNLIYFQIFKKTPKITVDLSQVQLFEDRNKNTIYLGASQLIKSIKKQNGFDYNITNVYPDTIALHWEKAFKKKVAVKSMLKLNFQKQYHLYDDVKVSPDTIVISGTYNDIRDINSVYTQALTLNDLSNNQTRYLNIYKPINKNRVKYFVDKVKIFIPVEKFTESEIEIPINIQADNVKNNIKIFPDKVKITYLVALKDFKKISQEMFVATCNPLSSKDINKAKINLLNFPSNIRITKIYPEKIEYIIFK